ncbi:MAG TPA: hypothetical protein VGF85_03525 [Opitutaceae bacterium]|jgi:hypothetical protein
MQLDIRYPIGLLFVIVGLILAACGLIVHPEPNSGHELSSNVDLFWGIVQVVFGAVMLALARAGSRKNSGKH